MRKSTILYITLNVVIMLLPILLLSALRYKIKTGDVVDLKAQEAARFTHKTLSDVYELEVTGSSNRHSISVNVNIMDSINTIGTDTTTYKYITYKLSGNKLSIHYDYEKDSLDNPVNKEDGETVVVADYEEYDATPDRSITIYLKSNLKKINALNSRVVVYLDSNATLINDLSVVCDGSPFTLNAPYLTKPSEDEPGEDDVILFDFPHYLHLNLNHNSTAELNHFGVIKKMDLDLRNGSSITNYYPLGEFNLTIDKHSSYFIDVNNLDQVKIKYE
ncbi:MAG: hypothetical protein JWM14_2306 [Chitinophagaceae bacterium]|nr:hypothetical protein [Chitinophagaceae bacterium]